MTHTPAFNRLELTKSPRILRRMNAPSRGFLAMLAVAITTTGCMSPKGETPTAQCRYVDQVRIAAIAELEAKRPELKAKLESAPGYAVFNGRILSLLHIGTRRSYGVVYDNKTGDSTYLSFFEFDLAAAIGFQVYRNVIVFDSPDAMRNFIDSGWEGSTGLGLTLKPAGHGFALHGMGTTQGDGSYTLTDKGLWAGLTFGIGRFYTDDELNAAKPPKK